MYSDLPYVVRDVKYAQIPVRAKFDQSMIKLCVPGRAFCSLGGVAVQMAKSAQGSKQTPRHLLLCFYANLKRFSLFF